MKIISKIENEEGLENFDSILAVSDGPYDSLPAIPLSSFHLSVWLPNVLLTRIFWFVASFLPW